jgi:hypothetical protein
MTNPALFLAALVAGYAINVLVSPDRFTFDRLALRAPIVAVFATVLGALIAAAAGYLVALAVFVPLVWCDVTPGKALGKHA